MNTRRNITLDSRMSIDSQVGVFTFIIGRSPTTHLIYLNRVQIRNSMIIGSITDNDCQDQIDSSSENILYSEHAKPPVAVDSTLVERFG
jgi:hypothetical protein